MERTVLEVAVVALRKTETEHQMQAQEVVLVVQVS